MKKIILLLCAWAVTATAQEPTKIAVMDLQAMAGIEAMTVSSLTDLFATAMASYDGYYIIARDDIKAIMSHMADQQALDCDETHCLVKIGNALGVPYLAAGNIGKVGDMYIINLKLINIEDAEVANRISEKYQGSETGLVKKMEECAGILLGKISSDGDVSREKGTLGTTIDKTIDIVAGKPAPARNKATVKRAAAKKKKAAAASGSGRKGGCAPVIASCCLGNPRLGYFMNQGNRIHLYDYLYGAGRYIQVPLWIIPAMDWGLGRSGPSGCCATVCWGPEAGRDFKTTRIRGKEIMLLVPVVNLFAVASLSLEVMSGTTWDEVVARERLQRR